MFNKKILAQLLDGSMTDHKTYVDGSYRGFDVILQYINTQQLLAVNIAAANTQPEELEYLNRFLDELKTNNKKLVRFSASDSLITLMIGQCATNAGYVKVINALVEEITSYLINHNYHSGCMHCGSNQYTLDTYQVNQLHLRLCPDCVAQTQRNLEENQAQARSERSNVVPGIVGAIVGAIIGAIIIMLIAKAGYVAILGGLAMSVLTLKGYEKLGGWLDIKGILISIVIMIIGVYFAVRLGWAWDAYDALKDYRWTFWECFSQLGYIVDQSDLRSSYILSFVQTYLFTALGSVGTVIRAVQASRGSYVLKKK